MLRNDAFPPALSALMATQGGVFTAAQAREHGLTDDDVQRMRRGPQASLSTLRRGVYALRAVYAEASPQQQHAMNVAALHHRLGRGAVLSHDSAAVELGLELLDPDLSVLHVTRETAVGARLEAGVHHYVADLPEEDVVRRQGALDHTALARTAIDVARKTNRLECAVAACDSALRMGAAREELHAVLARMRNWPGARFVATAIEAADGRAANPGESWSRVVLIQQGLAPDDLQVEMWDADGLVGVVDFRWRGVVGEFDGRLKYGIGVDTDPEQAARIVFAEKQREDRLRVDNEVVRWGYGDLLRPAALAQRVRAAHARAVARGVRPA